MINLFIDGDTAHLQSYLVKLHAMKFDNLSEVNDSGVTSQSNQAEGIGTPKGSVADDSFTIPAPRKLSLGRKELMRTPKSRDPCE